MTYQYDAFISYCWYASAPSNRTDFRSLVVNIVKPLIEESLRSEIGRANIFIDSDCNVSEKWARRIADAHLRSRLLIPILDGPYFHSSWCLEEWDAFSLRETLLLEHTGKTYNLIVPLRYADGDCAHEDARRRDWADIADLCSTGPAFKRSKQYLKLETKMKKLAETIRDLINKSPDWHDFFPLIQTSKLHQPPEQAPTVIHPSYT